MAKPFIVTTTAALLLAASSSTSQAQQISCDTLRAQIDTKIRTTGVSTFTLTVVDATASAPGRNVGSCERGARKILYVQTGAPGAAAVARPPRTASAPASPIVITECKDGSMPTDGRCR